MSRRPIAVFLDVLLVVLGTTLGLATNYLSNQAHGVPLPLRVLQHWALPVVGAILLLIVAGRIWIYVMEHPRPAKRIWTKDKPPYPGLEPLTEEYAAVFFGRDREIAALEERLSPPSLREAHRFVPVIGPSGSGKSSLIQAGLLPRLAHRRRWIYLPPFAPESRPIENLAASLAATLNRDDAGVIYEDLKSKRSDALLRYIQDVRIAHGSRSAVLIFVDQVEELLTLTPPDRRDDFLSLLRDSVDIDLRLWVVLALRSDFLTTFLETPFADLFHYPAMVGNVGREALFQIIEGPAREGDIAFAPGVVQQMINDAGGGDALPLLAYTLQELYNRVKPGGTVTPDEYNSLGGVSGTLSRQADKVMGQFKSENASEQVIETLLKFVAVEGNEAVRRPVRRASLEVAEEKIVDAFVNARLLATGTIRGERTIIVSHEALLRRWAPLRQAIDLRAQQLRWRADLERWALDWQRSGEQDAYLLSGERLASAKRWLASEAGFARDVPLVGEFVERSMRADRIAMAQSADSIAQRALAEVDNDPEHSLLLAVTAVRDCADTELGRRALLAALVSIRVRALLRGHEDGLRHVAWRPNGSKVASASRDRTVRVWDATTGNQEVLVTGHKDWVEAVAWSPDGTRLVSASRDRTARVWDAASGTELAVLHGHEEGLEGVAWSADGSRIATASRDRTVRVWDAASGCQAVLVSGHQDSVEAVAWSPDGNRLATASVDRTARVWDAANGTEQLVLAGHDDRVQDIAWSADGSRIATASRDRTVRVWDAATGDQAAVATGHKDWVEAVAWSHDGSRLVTASGDRTARVWDAVTGAELVVLHGHQDGIQSVAWSADGSRIATASHDRTVRIWDSEPGAELGTAMNHQAWVRWIAWSPDAERLATAAYDRTVCTWNTKNCTKDMVLRGHENGVECVEWSPDGRYIASVSADCTLRLWSARGGNEVAVLRGHDDSVRGLSWSPDSKRIVTCSYDRTARIWSIEKRQVQVVLSGHRSEVEGVSWAPDGERVATTSGDRTVRIWDPESGDVLSVLRGHEDWVRGVTWSPDGRSLATASGDRTARVWDCGSGQAHLVLKGHEDGLRGIDWSCDGGFLATASGDRTVRVWNVHQGRELSIPCVHREGIRGVAWSPDGLLLATASRDQTARIWKVNIDAGDLLARAARRVFRDLTNEEREGLAIPQLLSRSNDKCE